MADISDFRTKMNVTVKDTATRFTQAEKDNFINEAVRQYSRDRPRTVVDNLTGDGTAQTFAMPTAWQDRLSVLQSAEFPVDEVPRRFLLLSDDLEIFVTTSGAENINTVTVTLAASELMRLTFTTQHTVDGSTSTVPDNDFDAVCNLASAHFASALAAFYAESLDATHAADIVDHAAKATLFSDLAEKLVGKYKNHLETGEVVTAALRHFDWDVNLSRGADLLWHRRRFR